MLVWRHARTTQAAGPGQSLQTNCRKSTIFQWNARGLRSKLADFRYLITAYRFPFIIISEYRVGNEFRMNGYQLLHSRRLNGPSRLFVACRGDMPFVEFGVTPQDTNEFVCGSILIGRQLFRLLSAYLEPGAAFDVSRLENLMKITSARYNICGDFKAHNVMWGRTHTSARGQNLADLLISYVIEPK